MQALRAAGVSDSRTAKVRYRRLDLSGVRRETEGLTWLKKKWTGNRLRQLRRMGLYFLGILTARLGRHTNLREMVVSHGSSEGTLAAQNSRLD